ncbi:MAG: DUF5658 family protein [Dehalococcoidales bacterium]|nr:DUF5658 family protein [Dehalococcoidales bacterium]
MKILLALLVFLVLLDGVLTELLLRYGKAEEANPLLQPLVGNIGFMVVKAVGALLCALILWDVFRRFPKVASVVSMLAVAGYGIIVLWNFSLLLLA